MRKTATVALTPSSKRFRPNAETVDEAPRARKCVKKLAKKGEQEIHVIFSQTMGATTPSAFLISPAVKVSAMV